MKDTGKFRINLGTFDLVKGIAVIFMVMGHVISYYDVAQMKVLAPVFLGMLFAANGLMPLFFLISGFGFQAKPASTMLKKTAGDLLKPYVWVMAFVAVLFPIIHYLNYGWWPGALTETVRYLIAFLLGIAKSGKVLLGYSLYECTVVWFFLAMFIALNILNLIAHIQREKMQIALTVVSVFAGWALYKADFVYFCLPQGLTAAGFCYLGFFLKKHKIFERLQTRKTRYGVYLVLVLITLWQVQHRYNMAYGIFELFGREYVCAACSGVLFLLWGAYGGQAEWKGWDWIRGIGNHSLWLMCIHAVEQTCIPWYRLSEIMAEHQLLGFLIEISIKATIYYTVCRILKKMARRKYLKRRACIGK